MEYRLIKLKKALYTTVLLLVCINTYGQVRISNSISNMAAANSPAFIDASSNPTYNQSTNIGKGLLYPRTDLSVFTAFSGAPTGVPNSYPTLYDGLFVYNTKDGGVAGVGSTEGTLCRGLWYYDNPTSTITGGTWRPVRSCAATGTITTLNCAGATNTGTLIAGTAASGVSSAIGYTGGNGGTYSGQSVASTGVTGLTATLAAGSFSNGSGTLTYTITGTPSGAGTALFAINIGGQSCNVSFIVDAATAACGANIAPGVYKQFMCHNLGADTNLDPFIPAAGIHGAKYQWGRATPALTQAQDQASGAAVSGWNTTNAPAGSWSDAVKTANDPCPAGYRVPTRTQWEGVINNNALTVLGTWVSPNYTSALKFGSNLLLPAADNREYSTGSRVGYGGRADYWSSTQGFILQAFKDVGGNVIPDLTTSSFLTWGMSVRCISDDNGGTGVITTLNCAGATNNGTLIAGTAASGVSSAIGYTGGNGGTYSGQSVASTGVTGLTATLAAGSFSNGSGTLTYTITGTPSGAGTALFAINIGGQSCNVSFIVDAAAAACGANIAPGVYKQFMCHNLGADTNLDPFVPAAGIHGAKYQWGRATPALTQAQDQASGAAVSGWNTTSAPAGSWSDAVKTVNDPCPTGYRVPTSTQWDGVINNNALTVLGTWVWSNYTSALKFGSNLLLPAADNREYSTGSRVGYGGRADYLSSGGLILAAFKDVGGNVIPSLTSSGFLTWGMSVRCISE